MLKARKTVNVQQVKENVNSFLMLSICSPDRRQGQIDVMTQILIDAGAYAGFNYLTVEQVPLGHLPGIVIDGTLEDTPIEVRFHAVWSDSTRIKFL